MSEDNSEPEAGDRVTFFGTDDKEYDAVITKVWDPDTVNLAHAADEGKLQESTSVPRGDDHYTFQPEGS